MPERRGRQEETKSPPQEADQSTFELRKRLGCVFTSWPSMVLVSQAMRGAGFLILNLVSKVLEVAAGLCRPPLLRAC